MRRMAALMAGLIATPAAATAQGLSVNPYAGYYAFDESSFERAIENLETSTDPLYGIRVGYGSYESVSFDLAYGRTGVSWEGLIEGDILLREEATTHLFYGAANWHLPIPGPLDLFLAGGIGAMRFNHERNDTSHTDLMVNFGAGASLPLGPVRLRVDLKDHVGLCTNEESIFPDGPCFDDEALHNIEISAGIVIGT